MTTEELNTIVQAVIDKINGQVIDFDVAQSTPESTDLLSAVRSQNDGTYQGVTLKWDDVANAVTREAKGYRDDAQTAKTNVENMKASVEQTVSDFNTLAEEKKQEVQGVYQTDLNELKGDLDTERNERIEGDTALSTRLQKVEVASSVNRYEIDNLKAKAEGKLYRTETVEAEAYTVDVPSSVAPYAEVQKIGGKSVVWNQLVNPSKYIHSSKIENGITWTVNSDGTITADGTATKNSEFIIFYIQANRNYVDVYDGNKYFFAGCPTGGSSTTYKIFDQWSNRFSDDGNGSLFTMSDFSSRHTSCIITIYANTTVNNLVFKPVLIDLTKMFGSGNEPTLEECKKIFSAEYYPYDAGTIKSFPVQRVKSLKADGTEIGNIDVSSVTSDLKSALNAHDEWQNGKVIKRVGAVDLGVCSWNYVPDYNTFWTVIHNNKNLYGDCITSLFGTAKVYYPYAEMNTCGFFLETNKMFGVKTDKYTDVNIFKSAMSGVMLYYELATPIEETVPEIDNYINVEGGGSLTFESDETVKMPVPSTTRFVVDLT